jgi:hypothetical protein
MLSGTSISLEAIRKTDMPGDGPGIAGQRVETGPWLKAAKLKAIIM